MEPGNKFHLRPALLCCVLVFSLRLQLGQAAGDCPADGRTWVPFKDRCYHFVHGEEDKIKRYNFEAAQKLCHGFELLSVQSAEENAFVVEYSPSVWKNDVSVWLGMFYDSATEAMSWLGDEPVSYTNWAHSLLWSDLLPMDTCAALHSSTGKWENVSCADGVENGVVCETAQTAASRGRPESSALTAVVVVSLLLIMGISVAIWLVYQKHSLGTAIFVHPFQPLRTDQSSLVEAEETDNLP